eukprot:TRINITY_DN5367_c0_g1_i1.p1 TRINITY_DN5367_c0_g1~~TRINITY_DN5367_c0_g1_i1.p1  ORF type:complete len:477 (+),score=181.56 TRINITY_DN5367_c0_g1_i1:45-1433(+)
MDIKLFRRDPDSIRESQRRRFRDPAVVDEVLALDAEWIAAEKEYNSLNKAVNAVSKQIGLKKRAKEDASAEIAEATELKKRREATTTKMKDSKLARDALVNSVANLVHQSVPVFEDEEHNELIRKWGEPRQKEDYFKHHHQLLYMIDGYNPEAGAKTAGHRGYYLTGFGMLLNQALIQYALQFLYKKKYTPIQTPFFMKKEMMGKVAALAEFDEALYSVGGSSEEGKESDLYLIATSEQPMCALHYKSIMKKTDLPIKYSALSTCFRKEAGSYGRDAWGTYRVHQFEKIEQFIVCAPDESWNELEKLIATSEEFYQSLEMPFRVVAIVSKELNNAAAKKYDLEAWFPTFGDYRELVSASNCTNFQSRRMEINYGTERDENGQIPFVHLLNSTLTATERTLCCIMETFQEEKGIRIPKALQPFMAPYTTELEDPTLIPFVKEAPALGAPGGKKAKKQQQKKKK